MNKRTKLVNAGRKKEFTGAAVNPAITRASTIVFDSVQEMNQAYKGKDEGVEYYGRRGTKTTFALTEAMTELEGAAGCYVYPCGTAAITASLMSFLDQGDHLLMVDSVYEPTRDFVDGTLARMGIQSDYYDPMLGDALSSLVKPNTKVIFLESPGSLSMEVQDVPAIVSVAKKHGLVTMIDNTYASPVNFRPLDFGVDISIHSATKYLAGHSDVMLGVASANKKCWKQLQQRSYELGHCASPDDCYSVLKGIRTLDVRMQRHDQNARQIASWLQGHDLVDHVRHPALASCPGNDVFKRDFGGGNGLFSFVLASTESGSNRRALNAFLDSLHHFKMGFSWGGYESLVLGVSNLQSKRSTTPWDHSGPLVRLHVGLEDTQDLIADLKQGLECYRGALSV